MKSTVLIILLLLAPPLVLAQEKHDSAVPEGKKPVQQTTSGEDKVPSPVVWPKPFKPSEEIRADSQISFPTDI